MDTRIELKINDRLRFSDMECIIDHTLGRGSNVIAYVGQYRDYKYPSITHRVLIRELFPYDPKGMITRNPDGSIHIENEALPLYELNRRTFEKGIEVHNQLLKENPSDIDLNINNYEYNNTLYSLVGYTGGRNLYEELGRAYWKDKKASGTEPLLHIIRIIKGALGVLQTFHRSGYLHLDISPDNILLIGEDEKERVTLIDYNSVHTIDEVRGTRSVYYSTKEGFTAPEVQNGRNGQIREWTDLYSMTAVLYLCLTGKKLTAAQMVGVAPISIRTADSPFLKDCPETVLAMVRQILQKGLSVTAHRRYHSAAQMLVNMTELEDRIRGRGITHWALWEAGRERIRRSLKENPAMGYLLDEKKIYPIYAETEDGGKFPLLQNLADRRFPDTSQNTSEKNDDIPGLSSSKEESDKTSCNPSCFHAPLLLLGGGGMGKTTTLYRIACRQENSYHDFSEVMYYIPLYRYKDTEPDFICNTLLKSLKYKEHTDSMEHARHELMQLLDRPLCGSVRGRTGGLSGMFSGQTQRTGTEGTADSSTAEGKAGKAKSFKSARAPYFMLLLDGLNEASGDIAPLLEEIHALSCLHGVQIILTSRSDPGDPSFEKWTLCRLEQTEIRRILSEEGILPPENMEVFELLSFPMLLSIYIRTVLDGKQQLRLDSRKQLLDDYFDAILEKEKCTLPEGHGAAMGMEAVIRYLLPEIAVKSSHKNRFLTTSEVFSVAESCYNDLSNRALTAVFPEWTGHTLELRMGAENADVWYGKAVLNLLWKRLGLLVFDVSPDPSMLPPQEHGSFRIIHQILEQYLVEQSVLFHEKFDREKKRQRNWRIIIILLIALSAAASFGIYNDYMQEKLRVEQQQTIVAQKELLFEQQQTIEAQENLRLEHQQTLKNDSLALASSSLSKLKDGNRKQALMEAYQALPSPENNRPYVEEAEYALSKALYSYESNRCHHVHTIHWNGDRLTQSLSEDGKTFVLLDKYGKLSCYDVETGAVRWSVRTAFTRDTSWTGSDVYLDKTGSIRHTESRFPVVEIIESCDAVFCAGDRDAAVLLSLSSGDTVWDLSEALPCDRVTGHLEADVEVLDIAEDESAFVLGISEEKSSPDGTDPVYAKRIFYFDMKTGMQLSCTDSISSSGIKPYRMTTNYAAGYSLTGTGTFSGDGRYFITLHFYENESDRILCLDLSTGEVIFGPEIAAPETGYVQGSITKLLFVPNDSKESESKKSGGIFYYCCKYDWMPTYGYTGTTSIAFLKSGETAWTFAVETDLIGEAERIPEIIAHEQSVFLFSGSEVVRFDQKGNEQRALLNKRAICRFQDETDPSIVNLVNEDGTLDLFSLQSFKLRNDAPDYEEKYSPTMASARKSAAKASDFVSYSILDRHLSEGKGHGSAYLPFCVFPSDDPGEAVICSFFEDNRVETLPDPEKGSHIITDGEIYPIPDGSGFLFLDETSEGTHEDGTYREVLLGTSYNLKGEITDRFSFEPGEDYFSQSTTKMDISQDGKWLYSEDFLYHLKEHRVATTTEILQNHNLQEYKYNYRLADTKQGILAASCHSSSLALLMNGEPLKTADIRDVAADLQVGKYNMPYSMLGDGEEMFDRLAVGENELVILCGNRTGRFETTKRGRGVPVEYYLVYSIEDRKWTCVENESEQFGFPFLCAAKTHPWFATVDEDNRLLIYDVGRGKAIYQSSLEGDLLTLREMQFILDDKYLILMTDSGSVRYDIVRVADGKTVYTLVPRDASPHLKEIYIHEEPAHNLIYLMDRECSINGVCLFADTFTKKFEAPYMGCILGDSYIAYPLHEELARYPLYSLEDLLKQAEEILK